MRDNQWTKFDLWEGLPARLTSEDECYYARKRLSGGRYNESEANQDIANLQIPMSVQGQYRWRYKLEAVEKFASELSVTFPLDRTIAVAAIPCSQVEGAPDYDPKLEMVLQSLKRLRPKLDIVRPIRRKTSVRRAHVSGENRPSVQEHLDSFEWLGYASSSGVLVVVDDVMTAGTQFRAYKDFVLTHRRDLTVYGAIWARTVWNRDDLDR